MRSATRQPMFLYLIVLSIASSAGLEAWMSMFNNFAVEIAGLAGNHIGIIQSVREVPGFLALLAVFVIRVIPEHRLAALSIILLGAGLILTGLLPSFGGLILSSLIMSFGFHYYETANMSLGLQYFSPQVSPWVFGKLRSVSAAANIGVGLLIFMLAGFFSYATIYIWIGAAVMLAGAWGMTRNPVDRNLPVQRKQMVLRSKYWLFYFLTFMAGARRQIFMAFAVLLLVKKFGFSLREVTLLFVVNNLINYFLSPLIGKWIIRFGERRMLSLEYFSLIFIFTAYAAIDSKMVVGLLYILDHIVFNFSIAIRTFFQKIGDPKDFAPTMAVGFTINHIAAVVLPALGGYLWIVDYRIPFWAGAVMSSISLLAVQLIPAQGAERAAKTA
ncbi:MAG: MFS transporter [Desulfobacterales bacterium]